MGQKLRVQYNTHLAHLRHSSFHKHNRCQGTDMRRKLGPRHLTQQATLTHHTRLQHLQPRLLCNPTHALLLHVSDILMVCMPHQPVLLLLLLLLAA
jgi:hypothetical protein